MKQKAMFAAGCFWGVEYYFKKLSGVVAVESGYAGGHTQNPSYDDVCYKDTGHLEVVRVTYDASVVSYEKLVKYFFEIHDFTQVNGQGPDIGQQYLSAIFPSEEEREIVSALIAQLSKNGYRVATQVLPQAEFWQAEDYHQDYYAKTKKQPYCHRYQKIW
ncbi:MAG: peptide-methionine (S)-S-oxide reductase MsrA [Rickettsiales bacterium]